MSQRDQRREVSEIFLITRVSAPYRQYLVDYVSEQLGIPVHEICLGAAYTRPQGPAWSAGPSASARPSRIKAFRYHWHAASAAVERITRAGCPAVIVHGYNDLAFLRVMAACKKRGIPVFLRGDSNILDDRDKPWHRLVTKREYLRIVRMLVDGVMTMGTLGDAYYKHYGWDSEALFPVPYSIDFESLRLRPNELVLSHFRLESGIPEGRRLILYSGRLERVKRVDLLMQAFIDLAAEMPAWDLVLAGSGRLEDDLRTLVPANLEPRVHWLGWCDQDLLKVAYHASEILVLPSEHEPWAVVINEAIAAGLLPIASDAVGAAADLIEDGVSGFVFRSGDVHHLAEKVRLAVQAGDDMRYAARDRYQRFWLERNPAAGVKRAFDSVGYRIESP